jgi:hypothetical protein
MPDLLGRSTAIDSLLAEALSDRGVELSWTAFSQPPEPARPYNLYLIKLRTGDNP